MRKRLLQHFYYRIICVSSNAYVKCEMPRFSVDSLSGATAIIIQFYNIPVTPIKSPCPFRVTPLSHAWLRQPRICLVSLQIFLMWASRIDWVTQYVIFCLWLLPLTRFWGLSCFSVYLNFIPLNTWILIRRPATLHFDYPFTSCWTCGWLLPFWQVGIILV